MSICANVFRYHGRGGIWRGCLFTRQGGLNSLLLFLPITAPIIVSGRVTSNQMSTMMQMVPNGRAIVDRYAIATLFRKLHKEEEKITMSFVFFPFFFWEMRRIAVSLLFKSNIAKATWYVT